VRARALHTGPEALRARGGHVVNAVALCGKKPMPVYASRLIMVV
jgi:hypothetical protein